MSSGTIVTITGEVSPESAGITLPHEHLFVHAESWFEQVTSEGGAAPEAGEITLQTLTALRYRPFSHRDNVRIDDAGTVAAEIAAFQEAGGGTIVDLTPGSIGRDVAKLREVQAATGVHIVTGCGFYVGHSHPEHVATTSAEDLAEEILSDLIEGIGETGVRAGVIGEIGTSNPMHPDEEKVLQAVAWAQRRSGAPVSLHLSHPEDYAHEVLDILESNGADLNKVVVGHQDGQTPFDTDYHASIAARGAYVEYDLFGVTEFSEDGVWAPPPADIDRVQALQVMCRQGWASRMLVSHDVCTKVQQRAFGGFGFAHLPGHVSKLMLTRGLTEDEVHQIMVTNPTTWLTWAEPRPAGRVASERS